MPKAPNQRSLLERNDTPVTPIPQPQQQEMIPDPRYFIHPRDMYGNYYYDQYGIIMIDSRNGRRVIPSGVAPQPTPQHIMQQQPVTTPPPAKSVKDSLKEEFEMNEEFFLTDSEKTKKPQTINGGNSNMMQIGQGFFNNTLPAVPNPMDWNFPTPTVDVLSNIEPPTDIPVKVRYTKKEMYTLGIDNLDLAKYLLDKVFAKHPDLRYQLLPVVNTLTTVENSSLQDISDNVLMHELIVYKNGVKCAKFYVDLEKYAGMGLPIMHGILGKQYTNNHIVVPLGSLRAVDECITNAAYNGDFGVDAVTEEIFKRDMLPEYIYGTIDMSYTTPDDGRETYQEFGKMIEKIDKYYPLNTRYRLESYENNHKFELVSDGLVQPFNGVRPQILNTAIMVDGNKLTIEEPSGNMTTIMMGE